MSSLQHSYHDFCQVKRSHLMAEELCSGGVLNVYLIVVRGNLFFLKVQLWHDKVVFRFHRC